MSENKYSLICSTFIGTLNQLHSILFIHLSSHFIFQFLHVVLWSTLACLLACSLNRSIAYQHALCSSNDVIYCCIRRISDYMAAGHHVTTHCHGNLPSRDNSSATSSRQTQRHTLSITAATAALHRHHTHAVRITSSRLLLLLL